MITSEHKDITQWAMEFALKNGCSSARTALTVSVNNSFEYRNNQLDRLQQNSENKLYIELFVDGRYGSLSTNRLDNKAELEKFIKEGIVSTRFLAEDKNRQLPSPNRYYKSEEVKDLELFDKSFFEHSADKKIQILKENIEEIAGSDDRIVSVIAAYDDGCGAEYTVDSNGFEGEEEDSAFTISSEVSLKTEGDARPEAYWYDSKPYWNDLKKSGIAKRALDRALQKLGQQKVKSGNYMMLLDNTISSRILSPLISAMYGNAIQQKNTFLLNKLNTQITSSLLTVTDTPHAKRTFGARWYDGEGVATQKQAIIENGVLNTYFIDTYNSLKLGMTPTISAPSVLTVELGSKNCMELMKFVNKGILVTGFNGGNTNETTGDFSFGIEGFLIENGILTTPIGEMNVTGNMLDLWANLVEVGNDPLSLSASRQIPSLLFEDVSFSGL
ncbi:MAG: TldD/PmbA family protein [Dysgonomonas sp.]|nr:TldD/PmbA family protein [Dysgonomonas sp.]